MPIQTIYRKAITGVLTASLVVSAPVIATAQETPFFGSSSGATAVQESPVREVPVERVPVEQVQIDPSLGTPEAEAQGKISKLIKAGLELLKKINKGWYDTVISKATEGKIAFTTWWDAFVPGWIKNLFGSVAAAAIWQFIYDYIL